MSDKAGSTLVLSSTGGAAEHQGDRLGEFLKVEDHFLIFLFSLSSLSSYNLLLFFSGSGTLACLHFGPFLLLLFLFQVGDHDGRPYFQQRDTEGKNATFLYRSTDSRARTVEE